MMTFISLLYFTDQGIKNVKQSPERAQPYRISGVITFHSIDPIVRMHTILAAIYEFSAAA